jgi:hypothetical protein
MPFRKSKTSKKLSKNKGGNRNKKHGTLTSKSVERRLKRVEDHQYPRHGTPQLSSPEFYSSPKSLNSKSDSWYQNKKTRKNAFAKSDAFRRKQDMKFK